MAATASATAQKCLSSARDAMSQLRETAERARNPLLNGAVARTGVSVLLFPLDTMKTRAQLRTGKSLPRPAHLLRATSFLQNGKIALLRGAPAGALAAVGAGALSFIVYQTLARREVTVASTTPLPVTAAGTIPRKSVATALIAAEVTAGAWAIPLEGVKTRVQTGLFTNVPRALRSAIRAGPFAFYSGGGAHLFRELPTRALFLLLAVKAGDSIAKRCGNRKAVEAGVAGAAVGFATAPLDLVRTRVLAQRTGSSRLHANFFSCALDALRNEGPLAAWRGAHLRVAYLALSTGLFFAAYGVTENTLKRNRWLWYKNSETDVVAE